MKKYLFTSLAALSMCMAFGQNYLSGPMGVYGPQWNPATTIDPATGSVLVGTGGNWVLGGILTSTNAAQGITFSGGGTVSGQSSPSLYISNVATAVGSSAFTFPLGDVNTTAGTAALHSLGISAPSASTTATASYISSAATPNQSDLNVIHTIDPAAYWTMAATAATGATSTVTLVTRDLTNVFMPGAQVFVAGFNTTHVPTPQWEQLGALNQLVTGEGQSLSTSAPVLLSNYSAFTVGSTTFLLPITLVSFSGAAVGCTANLAWQTATESNSSYFAVESGIDASNFSQVGKVASKNSPTGASYRFSYPLGNGTQYFRLKAVDFDGKFSYSDIVSVTGTGTCGSGVQIMVSPNPASNMVNIQNLDGGRNRVALFDASGKKMTEITTTAIHQSINIATYASGMYILRIENASGKVVTVKVIKE